ncbi:MAG: type II secretion system inner membrane protein GspF [Betaproteobacteria bacterium]|nr:type II secretion system inner membrane protein GspF [Betaproteobacteria bacterium]
MTAFRYEAVDNNGLTVKGVVEVDTARQARANLRARDLFPVTVEMVTQHAIGNNSIFHWKNRFSQVQLALFTRQFATLLSAGLTVDAALTALVEQAENEYAKQILAGVRAEVLSGHPLARAMGHYGKVFPETYQALVHAGEESGELGKVMLRIADYTENRSDLRQKIMLAFLYPAAVTLVALMVITGLLVYVVPQVVSVFRQSHQSLPFLTQALIALSDALRASGIYLLVLLATGIWGARVALTKSNHRYRWHAFLLRMPLVGNLIRGMNTARFASTLAILVGSGVPLLQALQAGAMIVANLPMREAIEQALRMVKEGTSLSYALKTSQQFPPILIHLIASGEASGKLAHMLERAAMQQEQEMENKTAWLTGLMEPVLIVVMGGVVLLIVLAIMLPIIEMNQLAH